MAVHDGEHFLELSRQSIPDGKLVIVEGLPDLLLVLCHVLVEFVEGRVEEELLRVIPRLFGEEGVHVLVADGWDGGDIGVIAANSSGLGGRARG